MTNEEQKNKIFELESKIKTLEANYAKHQHDGIDGTNKLKKGFRLDKGEFVEVGYLGLASQINEGGQYQAAMAIGPEDARVGFVNKANIAQTDILYSPLATPPFATLVGRFGIIVTPMESTSLSISSAGNTVTIAGYNFVTNELADALINIYNSSGDLVSCRTIASNTSTVVTIDGTWGATESGCIFEIYRPLYSGSSQYIWQRYYTQEGVDGGIRFGVGITNGGDNGLLYSDATGDLYWRDKNGDSLKLNNAPTP